MPESTEDDDFMLPREGTPAAEAADAVAAAEEDDANVVADAAAVALPLALLWTLLLASKFVTALPAQDGATEALETPEAETPEAPETAEMLDKME